MHKPIHALGRTILLTACLSAHGLAQTPVETTGKHELIYCADRMSHEERVAYRARMKAARTQEEKDALRAAHRADLQARAAREGTPGFCDEPLQQRLRLREGQKGRQP